MIELPPRVVRVRLTGLLFETDKAFLLPAAMRGIRGLVELYRAHPGMAVAVTGHTDRVGGPAYNLGRSQDGVERGENRRAEVFLFDPGPVDPAAPGRCPGAGCVYETWKRRTVETFEFGPEPPSTDWEVFAFEVRSAGGAEL